MIHAPLRFGLTVPEPHASDVVQEVTTTFRRAGLDLIVVALPSYVGLFEAVHCGACDAAWAPPLVAVDLARCEVAEPVVAIERRWGTSYYSSILVAPHLPIVDIAQVAGLRFGWTNKQSASGYVVPRLHLTMLGYSIERLFSCETFFGSHEAAGRALLETRVDAIATFSAPDMGRGRFVRADSRLRGRVLATYGPIPNDVVVVRRNLAPTRISAIVRACLSASVDPEGTVARLTRIRRFAPLPPRHLAPLTRTILGALRRGVSTDRAMRPELPAAQETLSRYPTPGSFTR